MLEQYPTASKFRDRQDLRFRDVRGTCDTIYHELHPQGVGTEVKHAAVISSEEEDQLWLSGVLGCTNPKNVQNAVFFLHWKNLLRERWGGTEKNCPFPVDSLYGS